MLRDPACGTRRCPPWVTASRCVRSGHRFAPHLVPFPDRRQFVGSGMLGALAHAGLMCRNRLGMPRVVHSVTLAPRHVFAAVVTVPGGMFRRLAQIGRLGRRGRWRLGLNGRRGRIGSGCAEDCAARAEPAIKLVASSAAANLVKSLCSPFSAPGTLRRLSGDTYTTPTERGLKCDCA